MPKTFKRENSDIEIIVNKRDKVFLRPKTPVTREFVHNLLETLKADIVIIPCNIDIIVINKEGKIIKV